MYRGCFPARPTPSHHIFVNMKAAEHATSEEDNVVTVLIHAALNLGTSVLSILEGTNVSS